MAVPVAQPVPGQQQCAGAIVDRRDPPAPVELDDAPPDVVEQRKERRAERPCIHQRLPHPHELANRRQQPPDRLHPLRRPLVPVDGIVEDDDDAHAVRPVEPHVEAVERLRVGQKLVVDQRGLPFLLAEQRAHRGDPAVGQQQQGPHALVAGFVDRVVLPLEFRVALSAEAEPREEHVDIVPPRPGAEDQAVALRPAKLVDEPRDRRPSRHRPARTRAATSGCVRRDPGCSREVLPRPVPRAPPRHPSPWPAAPSPGATAADPRRVRRHFHPRMAMAVL